MTDPQKFQASGPVSRVAKGAIGNLTTTAWEAGPERLLPMPEVESFPGSGAAPRKCDQEERLAWAREMIRRAREGWPPDGQGVLPLKGG